MADPSKSVKVSAAASGDVVVEIELESGANHKFYMNKASAVKFREGLDTVIAVIDSFPKN